MRPRDLLDRARRIAAERAAMANVVDMTAAKAALLDGFDLNLIRMPLRREFLMRGMVIQYVAPDGTTAERVGLDEHFARRDRPPAGPPAEGCHEPTEADDGSTAG